MAGSINDKVEALQVDAVEQAPPDDVPPQNADEAIIRDLQNQGEEIGMTWRTIMAAIVRPTRPLIHRF
jgi:hypothetical protein